MATVDPQSNPRPNCRPTKRVARSWPELLLAVLHDDRLFARFLTLCAVALIVVIAAATVIVLGGPALTALLTAVGKV